MIVIVLRSVNHREFLVRSDNGLISTQVYETIFNWFFFFPNMYMQRPLALSIPKQLETLSYFVAKLCSATTS